MPRGHSDWNIDPAAISSFKQDNAELAARLGAPNIFNRQGNTIYSELFGDDITPWLENGSGVGNAFALDTTRYYFKPASIEVKPGTDLNQHSFGSRVAPLVSTGKVGFTTLVAFGSADVTARLRLDILHPTLVGRFQSWWHASDGSVTVEAPSGTENELVAVGVAGTGGRDWNFWKLVIDIENQRYDSVQVNDVKFDATDFAPMTLGFSDPQEIEFRIYAEDLTGGGASAYFDFVIITSDEP